MGKKDAHNVGRKRDKTNIAKVKQEVKDIYVNAITKQKAIKLLWKEIFEEQQGESEISINTILDKKYAKLSKKKISNEKVKVIEMDEPYSFIGQKTEISEQK